jgi:hypothetical protein
VTSPTTLLRQYPTDVQALIHAARKLVLSTLPGATEEFDLKAKVIGYGYGPGYRGVVATLILSRQGVKIGIARGAELPDPDGLLQGAGKVHRHIPITKPSDLRQPPVRAMLKAARVAWKKRTNDGL